MDKENAIDNFCEMIKLSWTYDKLTPKERTQLDKTFEDVRTIEALKGNYNQRWQILQAIYNAFLKGCGYNNFQWREEIR